MAFVKRIREGALIPRGYGVAWWDWLSCEGICLPIPLNVLASTARRGLIWLRRFGVTHQDHDGAIRSAGYAEGYQEGYNKGYDAGLRHRAIHDEVIQEPR